MVVIDTWEKVRGQRRGRNAYAEDYAQAAQVKALADEFRVAIVLVHHTKKGEAADFVEQVSGTMGVTAAPDSILVLRRKRGQASAFLACTGRDIEERDDALQLTDGLWSYLGPAEEFTQSEERAEILAHLRAHGPARANEIADATGKGRSTVYRHLKDLVEADFVVNAGGKFAAKTPTSPWSTTQ
jgi:DNA-binding transcriptional ArsR family regulator